MNEIQLIARQAMQIEELREELTELKSRIDSAVSHIICIGGPLNDNILGYSPRQLITFHNIANQLNYQEFK